MKYCKNIQIKLIFSIIFFSLLYKLGDYLNANFSLEFNPITQRKIIVNIR